MSEVEKRDNFLQKIHDDLLTCHICFEEMKDPRVLHCQHVLCWNCIEACYNQFKLSTSRGMAFPCPYCKQLMYLPKKGLATMPKCLYVNFVRDAVEGYEVCQSCETTSDNEMYICTDCSKPICSCCLLSHSERYHGKSLPLNEGNTVIEKIQRMLGKQEQDITKASSGCNDIIQSAKEECGNLKDLTKKMEDLLDEKNGASQSTMKCLEGVIVDMKAAMEGIEKSTEKLNKSPAIQKHFDLEDLRKVSAESIQENTKDMKANVNGLKVSLNDIITEVKKTSDEVTSLFKMRFQDCGSLENIKDISNQALYVATSVEGGQRRLADFVVDTNSQTKKNATTLDNCWNNVKSVNKVVDKLSKDVDTINKTMDKEREDIHTIMAKLVDISSEVKKLTRHVGQIKQEVHVLKEEPWYRSYCFGSAFIVYMLVNLAMLVFPSLSNNAVL